MPTGILGAGVAVITIGIRRTRQIAGFVEYVVTTDGFAASIECTGIPVVAKRGVFTLGGETDGKELLLT